MGINQYTRKYQRLGTYSGKLTENCLAEGTPVLTPRGWVPIQDVRSTDEVWDGEEFVRHSGCVYKGKQLTMSVFGVHTTPDHLLLTEEGWKSASSCEGHHRAACRLPDGTEVSRVRRGEIAADVRAVYDLKNCGPRSRFVVLGEDGSPVIVHNCTQSFARDILYDAMPRIEDAGYEIVLHVHDEVVTEADDTPERNHEHLSALLATPPEYALDMPLAAAGYEAYRYKKD
jgi:hypothetical protein